ncbi:MAG: hypothetical protein WCS27_09915 [Victivallaceae bacterium]
MMDSFSRLHHDVLWGNSGGKIIWQPRISCWFNDKLFAQGHLPAPYTGMGLNDIYRSLGCSARLYQFNACFVRVEDAAVRRHERKLNDTDTEIIIETPVGKQLAIHRHPTTNPGIIHLKWEVESEDELKVASWREEHTTWKWDREKYEQLMREVSDLGAPTMYMPRMNVQSLYIEKMGVEKGVYALYDWPNTVEAYFRALHESHDRLIDVINTSPINIINFGENVHSGTLSPDLFIKYHLPECRHRCERLHSAGKFVHSHWDGDCHPLLPYARETGLDGIEAITPRPQGDVSLEEIREALGDSMYVLDGIPAIYFDPTFSLETLEHCARRIIELFAPKLVLGISDEISSTGDLERIRMVGKIVAEYNTKREK